MAKEKLTALKIERKIKDEPGKYSDGAGLYLRVTKAANGQVYKGWFFQFSSPTYVSPKGYSERQLGLGSLQYVTLEQARTKADAARKLVADGIDPVDARAEKRADVAQSAAKRLAIPTFKTMALAYIEARAGGWKNAKHSQQWINTLTTYAFPVIGDLKLPDITKAHIEKIIRPIWTTKTETANRVRGRIELILDYAKARDYRSGDNPAAWRGSMKELLGDINNQKKKVVHHPRLHYRELPDFLTLVRQRDGISAKALELTILTAARTNEVLGINDAEVDFEDALWTIPAARMKAKRLHRVPLCDRAIEILRSLPREKNNPFFFVGSRRGAHLSNMAMLNLLEHLGRPDITVHGFRGTFKDWAHGETSTANEAIELALAHTKRDKVEAAYHHDDMLAKRRILMTQWETYCAHKPPKVIPMRRPKKA